MTLVAILSDTHLPRGSRRLPEACVELLRRADLVLHAGDVVAESVLRQLAGIARRLEAVHGNMDDTALRAALPRTQVVEVGGARIGMVHDAGPRAGREDRLAGRFPDCDAVVYGHTHLPQVERHGDVWILNPGSPTERRRAATHTMIELRIDRGGLHPSLVELSS